MPRATLATDVTRALRVVCPRAHLHTHAGRDGEVTVTLPRDEARSWGLDNAFGLSAAAAHLRRTLHRHARVTAARPGRRRGQFVITIHLGPAQTAASKEGTTHAA